MTSPDGSRYASPADSTPINSGPSRGGDPDADFEMIVPCGISDRAVTLTPELGDFESRTDAVHDVLLRLREDGQVPRWRDEA